MSLYIYHKNLTKSLRRQHRLWILTPFFWALPDFRVGPSNSSSHRRFGSNLWLETRWSIWVSKLQPNGDYKERQTPFAVPLQGHVPASSDWLCLELCVGCTATVSSIPWWHRQPPQNETLPIAHQVVPAHGSQDTTSSTRAGMETNSVTPKTLIPESPWKKERGKEEGKTCKLQTSKPQPQLHT